MILQVVAAVFSFLVWEAYFGASAEEESREPEELRPHLADPADAADPIIHHEISATDSAPSTWQYL